ncbi:MAG: redoxin family protein [Phycisphaeraceae bacterium]
MLRLTLAGLFAFASIITALASPVVAQEREGPAAPTLKLGDAAPKLHVSKWINGKPVESFEKGKVYIIDAWATWCGPCIAAMPHLSKLNTKYAEKGVVVIGLNVWEEDQTKVEPFLKRMGEKINFTIAVDEGAPTGKSAQLWMEASGQQGIPTTFIVDKEGRIAWIGHPQSGLEKALDAILAGTYDVKAETEKKLRMEAIQAKIEAAAEKKDWDAIFKLFDEVVAIDASLAPSIGLNKMFILLIEKKDYKAGYEQAGKLLENELKDEADMLHQVARFLVETEELEKKDLDVALKFAARAVDLTEQKNPEALDALAMVHFQRKEIDKAIEVQTKAAAVAEDTAMRLHLLQTLEKYKEAKAGK